MHWIASTCTRFSCYVIALLLFRHVRDWSQTLSESEVTVCQCLNGSFTGFYFGTMEQCPCVYYFPLCEPLNDSVVFLWDLHWFRGLTHSEFWSLELFSFPLDFILPPHCQIYSLCCRTCTPSSFNGRPWITVQSCDVTSEAPAPCHVSFYSTDFKMYERQPCFYQW